MKVGLRALPWQSLKVSLKFQRMFNVCDMNTEPPFLYNINMYIYMCRVNENLYFPKSYINWGENMFQTSSKTSYIWPPNLFEAFVKQMFFGGFLCIFLWSMHSPIVIWCMELFHTFTFVLVFYIFCLSGFSLGNSY